MTKKRESKSIKWGYSLIILSMAFVISSGLMFYLYNQNNPSIDNDDTNIVGSVKAVSSGEWESRWTPGYADKAAKHWSQDTRNQPTTIPGFDWIFDNCVATGNWTKECDGRIKNTLSHRSTSGYHSGWTLFGISPVQDQWKVEGDINGDRFIESWRASNFVGSPIYHVTKTSSASHHGIFFTGRARLNNSGKLQFETYRGTEHTIGFQNAFLNKHEWLNYGSVPRHWGIAPNGSNVNVENTHTYFNDMKKALIGQDRDFGIYYNVAQTLKPESWTITGCFTDTGSCS